MNRRLRYSLILGLSLVLWNTPLIKPLKILTVFFHELGHALMAWIFGQGITGFQVHLNESGYTMIRPTASLFSNLMIANGGYMGSLVFAVVILLLAETRVRNYIPGALALIFLAVSVRFSGLSFTLLYAVAFAAAVMILYMIHHETLTAWVLDIIGVACAAYAVYDVFVDTILMGLAVQFHWNIFGNAGMPKTDAVQLQSLTGVPAMLWGALWLVGMLLLLDAVIVRRGSGGANARSRGRSK